MCQVFCKFKEIRFLTMRKTNTLKELWQVRNFITVGTVERVLRARSTVLKRARSSFMIYNPVLAALLWAHNPVLIALYWIELVALYFIEAFRTVLRALRTLSTVQAVVYLYYACKISLSYKCNLFILWNNLNYSKQICSLNSNFNFNVG